MSLSNFERHLIDRVKISRLEKKADSFGGYSTTEKMLYKGVPARFYGASGDLEREIAGKTLRASLKMMLPKETDIQVGDLVTDDEGFQYIVIWIRDYRGEKLAHHLTVELATYTESSL